MSEAKKACIINAVLGSTNRKSTKLIIGVNRCPESADLTAYDGFYFVDFNSVNRDLIVRLQPEIVFSPLFGRDYDAIDIAEALGKSGYHGQYMALSSPLPDTDIVRHEVAKTAPALDFDVLSLTPEPALH